MAGPSALEAYQRAFVVKSEREADEEPISARAALERARQVSEDAISEGGQTIEIVQPRLRDEAHVITGGLIEGVPVAGPAIRAGLDWVGSRVNAVINGTDPTAEYEAIRGRSARLKEEYPVTNVASQVAGGVASMAPVAAAVPGAFGIGTSSMTRAVGAGAGSGAAISALDQVVRDAIDRAEGPSIERTAAAAGVGAMGGAIGAAVGRVAGQAAARKSASRISTERLPADQIPEAVGIQARRAYGRAERLGFSVPGKEIGQFTARLKGKLTAEGFSEKLHGPLNSVLGSFDEAAGAPDISLRGLDQLRRQLGSVAQRFNEPDTSRLARAAIEELDVFVHHAGGSGNGAGAALAEARKLWSTRSKVQVISNALADAELSPSNPVSAMRTALRPLLKNGAARLRRAGFSVEERKAIRRLVDPGLVDPIGFLSRLGPTNVINLGITGAAGWLGGGPTGAALTTLAGWIGSKAAGRAARVGAENIVRGVARGSMQAPTSVPVERTVNTLGQAFGIQSSRALGGR